MAVLTITVLLWILLCSLLFADNHTYWVYVTATQWPGRFNVFLASLKLLQSHKTELDLWQHHVSMQAMCLPPHVIIILWWLLDIAHDVCHSSPVTIGRHTSRRVTFWPLCNLCILTHMRTSHKMTCNLFLTSSWLVAILNFRKSLILITFRHVTPSLLSKYTKTWLKLFLSLLHLWSLY